MGTRYIINSIGVVLVFEELNKDVYALFERDDPVIDEDRLNAFANELAGTVRNRLAKREERQPTIRMSNLGKPDRRIWYDFNSPETSEKLDGHTLLKFLYGDILECLLMYLAEEAGHKVERRQEEVVVDGIVGHIDGFIDDVLVDVKSSSSYGFKKFRDGSIREDDPFGYLEQLAGYANGTGADRAAFWAIDKQNGTLALTPFEAEELASLQIPERIQHLKEVVVSEQPPERCYEAEPEGKAGNMALSIGCSYCSYKFNCWSDANDGYGLRVFAYSNGPKFLTEVIKEPLVKEIGF